MFFENTGNHGILLYARLSEHSTESPSAGNKKLLSLHTAKIRRDVNKNWKLRNLRERNLRNAPNVREAFDDAARTEGE